MFIWSYKTNIIAAEHFIIPALGLASPKLNEEVKNPNGKAPIPNDMWKPPSPNPKPGNPYEKTSLIMKTTEESLCS